MTQPQVTFPYSHRGDEKGDPGPHEGGGEADGEAGHLLQSQFPFVQKQLCVG
jgi:hypothetical protein